MQIFKILYKVLYIIHEKMNICHVVGGVFGACTNFL